MTKPSEFRHLSDKMPWRGLSFILQACVCALPELLLYCSAATHLGGKKL